MVVSPKHPKMIIFSRKIPWLLGTTILGNPHIYIYIHHVTHTQYHPQKVAPARTSHKKEQETERTKNNIHSIYSCDFHYLEATMRVGNPSSTMAWRHCWLSISMAQQLLKAQAMEWETSKSKGKQSWVKGRPWEGRSTTLTLEQFLS